MPEVKKIAVGIVTALIAVMVGYLLFNSLFTPTNTAVTDLNTTLQGAGYTTEGTIASQAWSFYLLAIPLTLLAGAVYMIISAFR
jgi:hypothetical protein